MGIFGDRVKKAQVFIPKIPVSSPQFDSEGSLSHRTDDHLSEVIIYQSRHTLDITPLTLLQDDLFPMTIDLTSPVLSADEWKQGKEYKLRRLDLCPDGVKRFSEVEVVRTSSQQSKIQQEVHIHSFLNLSVLYHDTK